jgi:hypothetical protein
MESSYAEGRAKKRRCRNHRRGLSTKSIFNIISFTTVSLSPGCMDYYVNKPVYRQVIQIHLSPLCRACNDDILRTKGIRRTNHRMPYLLLTRIIFSPQKQGAHEKIIQTTNWNLIIIKSKQTAFIWDISQQIVRFELRDHASI